MTKITIKNVASFKSPVTIETDKPVNLIYGLNGTGKTTISNFLYHQNNSNSDMNFSNCTLNKDNDEKVLVYNQNFIYDHFYNQKDLKGIFTLSRENKNAEFVIANARKEITKFETKIKTLDQQDLKKTKNDLSNEKDTLTKTLWKIKEKYTSDDSDRVLNFCLEGFQNSKIKLFNYIIQISKPNTKPNKTIDNLKKETKTISDNAQKQEPLSKIDLNISDIENNNIFSKVIVGNEESPISTSIKALNNSDWVKQGLDYLPDNSKQCPFCQKETLTQQVEKNIRNYFDETYNNNTLLIKNLQQRYNAIQLPKATQYKNNNFVKEDIDKFNNLYYQLQQEINNNKNKIKQKSKEPSQTITLLNTTNLIQNLNIFIADINNKITKYNQKIDNKLQTKQNIKNIFWQIMRWDYDSQIKKYGENKKKLDGEIKGINTKIKKYEKSILSQKSTISEQQQKFINIDESINNINRELNDLGIEGFSIEKHENYYKIVRSEQQNDNFKTLSEGEKMIISFLYFIELCKGKDNAQDTNTQDNKIIVIDDPISSLSHTYIFNISQLIKKIFFETYKQVFVLTHSLYFFHELVRYTNNKQLFRLTKSNTETQIHEMKKNEIQNDYQAYWQVIKDHKNGKASDALLANSMRNILECFFGFINKDKLCKVIKKFNSNKFNSFERYINRESHSDLTNITDNKEINTDLFKEAFKSVFDESNHLEHYEKMIK